MAGHSHWSSIKHKKAATDKKRGKLWSMCSRNIITAARLGGGDPEMNSRLRLAVDKAKSANMPKDTIEKAIKKGTGDLQGEAYKEVIYEGYGAGGVAVMASALTDNRNRTGPELKKIFERHGGNLGESNCVSWMFSQKGVFIVDGEGVQEDQLMEIALEAGAEDVQGEGTSFTITCDPSVFEDVKNSLSDKGIQPSSAEVTMIPSTTVTLDADVAGKVLRLMDALDDQEDVQSISANFDIPDEVLAKVENG